MVQQGWIKLHRQIIDSSIWDDKPFNRGAAWIDILLNCNHSDNKTLIDGRFVPVKRGQWVTSILKLSERWGWGREKTTDFLKALEGEGMILRNSTRKHTTLTVLNYAFFQDLPTTDQATDPTTDRQLTRQQTDNSPDINKNVKNVKNEKKNIYKGPAFSDPDIETAFQNYATYRQRIRKPLTDRATTLLINKLQQLAGDNKELSIRIIDQSIERGWQSFYPIKEDSYGNARPNEEPARTDDDNKDFFDVGPYEGEITDDMSPFRRKQL